MNNDQMFSPDGIAETLISIPKEILLIEQEIARAKSQLDEREETLQIAIVNASLNAPQDGSNAPARELQRKQAVAANAEVKIAQTGVTTARIALEQLEARNKQLSRSFAAWCHVAELKAAQMILMSKGETK